MSIEIDPRLSAEDQRILSAFIALMATDSPSLEQIWSCMDFVWAVQGCDNQRIEPQKLARFYAHPVWLLNGLFVEQHAESLAHRELFSDWVRNQNPARVADIGGGFGTLAAMIKKKLPDTQVDVIEPHSHGLAAEKGRERRVNFCDELSGEYDILIATDVFEHVEDPLSLVESTAAHLAPGGRYLMANCFFPVIKCHLPCTFHFRFSWVWVMRRMNLVPVEKVAYGTVFRKEGPVESAAARNRERWSRLVYRVGAPALEGVRKLRSILRWSWQILRDRSHAS